MNLANYIVPCSLASELRARLLPGSTVSFDHIAGNSKGSVLVRGIISLSHEEYVTEQTARCTFVIPARWRVAAPEVRCGDSFLTREIDWHVYPQPLMERTVQWSALCWVLSQEWMDSMEHLVNHGVDIQAKWAAEFMTRNTKTLLYRHYLGRQLGLEKWQWPEWSHGRQGFRQYANFKRKHAL